MNVKRIATLSAAGAVLAAMIAGATTSGVRRAAPVTRAPDTATIELRGAELAAEVARLRARLRPTDEPQQPARNLFQFGARAARSIPDRISEPAPEPLPAAAPPPPPFTLVGFATDDGVRTAILSGLSDLHFVKEGETLASQYRVVRIGADGVDVSSLADGAAFTLRLPQ